MFAHQLRLASYLLISFDICSTQQLVAFRPADINPNSEFLTFELLLARNYGLVAKRCLELPTW